MPADEESERSSPQRARRAAAPAVTVAVAVALVAASLSAVAHAGTDGWRRDVPCGRVLDKPRAVARSGCTAAHCVAGGDDVEICACKDAAPAREGGDAGGIRMTVARAGREVAAWPVEPMLGETGAFRVTRADLDGDGRDEWLVAVLDTVSNGMAVQSWTACVLDGRDPAHARPCVPVDDESFFSMPTRQGRERACRLIAARWRWGSEPRRGDGLYLVGRWLAYRKGSLTPDPRRPVVARRYLYRFAAERARKVESSDVAPVAWWQDATTRALRCPTDELCGEEKEP